MIRWISDNISSLSLRHFHDLGHQRRVHFSSIARPAGIHESQYPAYFFVGDVSA